MTQPAALDHHGRVSVLSGLEETCKVAGRECVEKRAAENEEDWRMLRCWQHV